MGMGLAGGLALARPDSLVALAYDRPVPLVSGSDHVPPRHEKLRRLAQGTAAKPYDVLIIGGGATGTGCALDAVTR